MSSAEIVMYVHDFYSHAWNMLIAVFSGLLLLIGIAFPLIAVLVQRRYFSIEEEKLKRLIASESLARGEELSVKVQEIARGLNEQFNVFSEEVSLKFVEQQKSLMKEIARSHFQNTGALHMLQGKTNVATGDYKQSVADYHQAVSAFCTIRAMANVSRILGVLEHDVMPYLKRGDLESNLAEGSVSNLIDSIIKTIRDADPAQVYIDHLFVLESQKKAILSSNENDEENAKNG